MDEINKECFNRTFMELKYETGEGGRHRYPGFNRTFMELKFKSEENNGRIYKVLIVPLWN